MNNDKMEHIIFGLQCENNELNLKNIMLEAELNKLKETYTCDYRRNSWKSKFFKAQEEIERLKKRMNDMVKETVERFEEGIKSCEYHKETEEEYACYIVLEKDLKEIVNEVLEEMTNERKETDR